MIDPWRSARLMAGLMILTSCSDPEPSGEALRPSRPALTVRVVQPSTEDWPMMIEANGSIAAWQEAIISAELGGVRLVEVVAEIGDRVEKGQVLARFDRERVLADLAQSEANLAEAEAMQREAQANARRVRTIIDEGALSALQAGQYLTQEKTAEARVRAARAQRDIQALRLRHTEVVANDRGIISGRKATLGAVPSEGSELFRLVRQERLEWRGEVTAPELPKLQPGGSVMVEVPDVGQTQGHIRMLAPTLDEARRFGLVYVDLDAKDPTELKPGMFAHGRFVLGFQKAMIVPQTALLLRDGFSYVFEVQREGTEEGTVSLRKVTLGRAQGDQVELLEGPSADQWIVESGAAFLADGDRVRVIP